MASAGRSAWNRRRRTAAAVLIALAVVLAPGVRTEPRLTRFEFQQPHMGTTVKVVLYATDSREASKAAGAAFARVAELDAILSDYRAESELSRLTERPAGRPVAVSDDLFRVLSAAQSLAKRSDGAFDITVGPLSRLWRRARRQIAYPSAADLDAARAVSGHDLLRLDPRRQTVTLERAGMRLDPGGIAKGFAADEALLVLRKLGAPRALVAVGGDLALGAPPPGADGWRVTLAGLDPGAQAPGSPVMLSGVGVSTSGDAEQWVEIDGRRYSHIVDPRTGVGIQGHSSVSVIAPCAMTSDMLATAASVLGPGKGLAVVEDTPGAAALMGIRTPGGDRWRSSSRWPGTRRDLSLDCSAGLPPSLKLRRTAEALAEGGQACPGGDR